MKRDELLKQLHDIYICSDSESCDNIVTAVENTKSNSQTDSKVAGTDISNLNINDPNGLNLSLRSNASVAAAFANKSDINDENHETDDLRSDEDDNKINTDDVKNKNNDKYFIPDKYDGVITEEKGSPPKPNKSSEVTNCEGVTMHYLRKINSIFEIEALSGAKAMVPIYFYHGISFSHGNIHCMVCRKMVTDKNEHIYEKEHMIKVQGPIEDGNFYRQVSLCAVHCVSTEK